jgi:predicted membrane protein (TIGR00267 family)
MKSAFFRGFIDGSLSTLGIVIGASSASTPVIVAAAIGGTLANSISNLLSAFSAERVNEYEKLRQVEQALVTKSLKNTVKEHRILTNTFKKGGIDGIATMLGGIIPVFPYLFFNNSRVFLISTGLVVMLIGIFGIYIGKVSRKNLLLSGIKMAVFGLLVATLVYLLQLFIIP